MGKRLRRAAVCLLATAILVTGLMSASASAATADPEDTNPWGQALMTAAKAAGVLAAIEGSLVYLGAKYESVTDAKQIAAATTPSEVYSSQGSDYEPGDPLPPA
jgi:hypothetical protein